MELDFEFLKYDSGFDPDYLCGFGESLGLSDFLFPHLKPGGSLMFFQQLEYSMILLISLLFSCGPLTSIIETKARPATHKDSLKKGTFSDVMRQNALLEEKKKARHDDYHSLI